MLGVAIKIIGVLLAVAGIVFVGPTIRERVIYTPQATAIPTPKSSPTPRQPEVTEVSSLAADQIVSALSDADLSLELQELDLVEDLTVGGSAFIGGSLSIGGNQIVNLEGKVPALNGDYFADLNGENITNVDAHHLGGKAASSFLRSDEPDTASAVIDFTASPGSTDVSGGSLFVNPAGAQTDYTLFGVAVAGAHKLRLDAEGDMSLSGSLMLDGGIDAATTLRAGAGDGFTVDANGNITRLNAVSYSFPSSQGAASSLLMNDGTGALSWETLGAAAVTPDSLDFAQFEDALDLDASTDIAITGSNVFSLSNTGTGNSLVVNDEVGDTTPFVVDASGNVGIGATTPTYALDVSGDIRVSGSDIYSAGSLNLHVGTGIPYLVVSSDGGNLGLGNGGGSYTRPQGIWQWLGSNYINIGSRIEMSDNAFVGLGPSSGRIEFDDQATDEISLLNANVGIGTVSPSTSLDTYGAVRASNSASNYIQLSHDSFNPYISWAGGNQFTFRGVDGSGNNIQIIPMTDGVYYLGTNIKNWGFVYSKNALVYDLLGLGTVSFGSSADNVFAIGNGTAPTTSIVDGVQLWAEDVAASSELRVRDEAGNVTTLSPHNFTLVGEPSEEMAWSYYSERGDVAVSADMACALRLVEQLSGKKLIHIKNLSTGEEVSSASDCTLNSQGSAIEGATNDLLASNLTVLGNAILPDTVVNGKLTVGVLELDNTTGSINSVGTLSIQPLGLGAVEFFSGKVTLHPNGDISLAEGVIQGNDKIRGTVEFQPGQTSVEVSREWETAPVSITVTPSFRTDAWVTGLAEDGFTIHVELAPSEPQRVYWQAMW